MTTPDIIQILVGLGVGGGIGETWRWFFGGARGKAKIDNAKVVEAMALDLLKPLNDQVSWASGQVQTLQRDLLDAQKQVHRLQGDLESMYAWALAVKAILEDNQIVYPPVPTPVHNPPRKP
jgi:hypothetical protein